MSQAAEPAPTRPGQQAPRSRMGCVIGLSLVALVLLSAGGFVVPTLAPQATCDLLGSRMGCEGGATPTCTQISRKARRGTVLSIDVACPEGGGSPAAIWTLGGISAGVGVLQFFVVLGIHIATSIKRTRALRH